MKYVFTKEGAKDVYKRQVLLHHDLPEDALLCPMIDARRMEVYAAVYDRALSVKREIAVSYTHLDVYKRQLQRSWDSRAGRKVFLLTPLY